MTDLQKGFFAGEGAQLVAEIIQEHGELTQMGGKWIDKVYHVATKVQEAWDKGKEYYHRAKGEFLHSLSFVSGIKERTLQWYLQVLDNKATIEAARAEGQVINQAAVRLLIVKPKSVKQIAYLPHGWEDYNGGYHKNKYSVKIVGKGWHLFQGGNTFVADFPTSFDAMLRGDELIAAEANVQAQEPSPDLPHKPFDSPVTIKLNPDQADDAPVPTAEEGGDDSDPNDEEAEAPKPTEPAQEPTKTHQEASKPLESKQDTNHQHGCHNFQLVGDTLQCLNRKGQTVILVAPTKQHMSDMLGDVLHDGLAVYAKAKLFQSLKAPNGDKTIRQIAEVFGLTQADVRKHLCLLTLTAEEQQQVATCKLPVDEAYRILAMRQHERKPAGQNTEAKSEQKQAKKPVKKRRAAK